MKKLILIIIIEKLIYLISLLKKEEYVSIK